MRKYVDAINDAGILPGMVTMLGDAGIFKWNDTLQAYVMSANGMIAQMQTLFG